MSLASTLNQWVTEWAAHHCPDHSTGRWVQPCQNPQFGHFQSNLPMVAAKTLRSNPRDLATSLANYLSTQPQILSADPAGPGFVNIRFANAAIEHALSQLALDPRLGLPQTAPAQTIVVDFSSPNVAKSMHVGHIRSTILGDSIARLLRALGHHVITDNHIGDWGTAFGKIILAYKQAGCPPLDPHRAIEQMETWYQDIHRACTENPSLLKQAKAELLKLQQGDPVNTRIWESFRTASQNEFDLIYQRLGVSFDHTLGESFYNPWLQPMVDELIQRGIARESNGAICLFFDEPPELRDEPMVIRKSDGAALYATTDLATLRYRIDHFHADTIIYVTDGRQQLHFKQLFAAARQLGLNVRLEHAWFGTVLGPDKKPLKTRDGTPIKLRDLLDEAVNRAAALLRKLAATKKGPTLSPEAEQKIAEILGIGAVKYADQAQNRHLDYVFDWDKLLALEGNTAPYLINAYVRCRSILRKQGLPDNVPFAGEHPLDHDLARACLAFGDAVENAASELRPHLLCAYLFELASLFHRFFEACPVAKAPSPQLKHSRLLLCHLTASILQRGLDLLGIPTVEEM
ncbi:MAG: arginine--tRNA ligase [Verrucomicrobiia bacterium]